MFIGIDVGGTNIRVAEFDDLHHPQLLDFKIEKNNQDYQKALGIIKTLVGDQKPERIGVGAPGSANLPNWRDHNLKNDLEEMFTCPVVLANDVAAAASGEAHYGIPANKNFLFVAWGTGIGGAYVHDLQITPTQIGHQVIVLRGKECGCGQKGCLEAYCGGRYIKEDHQFPEIVPYFAQGLVNCVAINPVPLIIFAGGLATHHQETINYIADAGQDLMKIMDFPKVTMATFGDKAGVYGALSLLKSTL